MIARTLCLVALCAGTLAACASQSDQDDAAAVASRFLDATKNDPGAACALLTPRTRAELETSEEQPCDQALPELGGTVGQADTWSDQARVKTDRGTVYLTEYDDRWLVAAAGCRSDGDAPDFCVVGG